MSMKLALFFSTMARNLVGLKNNLGAPKNKWSGVESSLIITKVYFRVKNRDESYAKKNKADKILTTSFFKL